MIINEIPGKIPKYEELVCLRPEVPVERQTTTNFRGLIHIQNDGEIIIDEQINGCDQRRTAHRDWGNLACCSSCRSILAVEIYTRETLSSGKIGSTLSRLKISRSNTWGFDPILRSTPGEHLIPRWGVVHRLRLGYSQNKASSIRQQLPTHLGNRQSYPPNSQIRISSLAETFPVVFQHVVDWVENGLTDAWSKRIGPTRSFQPGTIASWQRILAILSEVELESLMAGTTPKDVHLLSSSEDGFECLSVVVPRAHHLQLRPTLLEKHQPSMLQALLKLVQMWINSPTLSLSFVRLWTESSDSTVNNRGESESLIGEIKMTSWSPCRWFPLTRSHQRISTY